MIDGKILADEKGSNGGMLWRWNLHLNGDMGILWYHGILQTTICECIWKICCGSGWVNCSSMLSQCQSAMLYAITGWRFQHGDLRSWGQPNKRPFARWWFQIVVVWLWTYMNIECIYIYIYITIHIISDTFRQSRDHLRFLDRECWDVIHLSGSVGMSSTCGAGSMHPGWPLLGSSSEMLVTFTGLNYCTFFSDVVSFFKYRFYRYYYV